MRTSTLHAFCFAERISIGNDILFREVEHINRINCNPQEAGFEMKMRTSRTSGVTTQTDYFSASAFAQSHIVQGYISSARGRTVRVRIRDDKGYLTIKGASNASGTSRYEWEKELALSEAEELMRLCEPGIIDKTRYLVRSGKHVFEVDEFYGENEGLIVAEVELESEDEAFVKPDFIGEEVTGDIRYYNSQLMKKPYKTW